ncbi:MAG: aromatic ring-hydroxylating dioxygenase subunit alpha [Alphaproteobacteria bacterium]|nr:aromatic ring-hydroxylating dioxygenase subunit alpha [Alphaproteobacteria bacterium]
MPLFDPTTPFAPQFSADPYRSATLPGFWYYDPAIFAAEREAIFYKSWQFAGYQADLKEPGAYITAEILDQKVFVIRAKDGALLAFHNVCMHRGHTLLEGKGEKTIITCPFHAWSYDTHGALKAAGNAENVRGFRHEDFSLTPVQVETFLHMVFVNLDPKAPSLASQAGAFERYVREHIPRFDELKFARRDPIPIASNWKFVFDGLECYHCPVIHPEAVKAADYDKRQQWSEGIYSIHFTPPRAGIAKEDHLFGFRAESGDLPVSYVLYLWPNNMFMARRGEPNFAFAHVMPTGLETTIVNIDHFYLSSPPKPENVRTMDAARDVIWPQDTRAMALQQLGVHARGYRQGRLMVDKAHTYRSEHTTHHFDKMVWDAVTGAMPDAARMPSERYRAAE